ncbi:hypothetical protein C8D77_1011052 [Mesorhizobium loti]|uniref:Uncharacterized protein n=1 Tax=Rhizobium loti TaxID=381 RepID=A0A8E2WI10_RHILI|nr:hypothetical protein C8D77_1011052 [Mesorhizobium loti]
MSMSIGWSRSAASSMASDVIWPIRKTRRRAGFSLIAMPCADQVNEAVKRWMRVQASSNSVSEVA